jgi:hypothetical protein
MATIRTNYGEHDATLKMIIIEFNLHFVKTKVPYLMILFSFNVCIIGNTIEERIK